MRLSVSRLIRKDDMGAGLPAWLDKLLEPLNQFMEQVVKGFDRNLTFKDNFLGTELTQKLIHDDWKDLNPSARGLRVKGVQLVDASGEPVVSFGWRRNDDGSIGVKAKFESGAATEKSCVLQIQLGS